MNKKQLTAAAAGLALLAGGAWFYRHADAKEAPAYRFAAVERGSLTSAVSATGALSAVRTVQVGTQVSGQVSAIYVDFNDRVRKGQLIARIDPTLQQQAVRDAEAGLDRARAALVQAQSDYDRNRQLHDQRMITDVEWSTAQYNLAVAQANAKSAQVTLDKARQNLAYTSIYAPIDGVVVERNVDVGQTVAASLQAPTLFVIANDLSRMQVLANVDEADVGKVKEGMVATFTVDAFPGRVFKGVVAPDQPRLNASMTQNVVTYTVVVKTDNPDGKLLPYLTANLRFQVDKRSNVLLVPNTALRYKPDPQAVVPEARGEYMAKRNAKAPDGEKAKADGAPKARNRGTLWVEDGGFVRPVKVQTGLTNGLMTEVVGGDIKEGDAVVIGENRSGAGGGTSNPFTPKLFNKKQ
jgi:HlyD family secretion protein